MSHFPHHFHYFSHHVNREVKEVYWQAVLANLAMSMSYIFEPIYLFSQGRSISLILLFYAQVYFWYSILIFPVAKITAKIGYKHSIFISNIFFVIYWVLIYFTANFSWLLFVAPFFYGLEKSFFWPAFNSDIAVNSEKGQQGREVGALFSLIESTAIVGPFIGGLLSSLFGFGALFGLAAVLMLFSIYPLFKSPEIYTKHEFRFRNFIKIFRRYPANFFGYWGYAEDLMLMTIWPIVIFTVLHNTLGVGLVTTVASTVSIMLMLIVGKLVDKRGKNIIPIASLFYGFTWIFRFFARSIPSVLAFDVLTRTSKGVVNVPMVSLTYEIAGKNGPDHAIAYSVFYEWSLSIGKIVTALLGILILAHGGNISYIFILAGVMTMFYGLIKK